jgi:PKD repeat protein
MNRISVYGLTCVLMIAAAAARATTIVMPADEQLVEKSPAIVAGSVISTSTVERDGAIWTEASISIIHAFKGGVAGTITVREIGGELDGRFTKIFGGAELKPGERVLLFLEPSPHGGYRTMDLFVGKMTEGRQLDGRRLWIRDDVGADVVLLDAKFQPVRAKNVQRDANGFEAFVTDRVAGRAGQKNYGVENPVLANATAGTTGGAKENFTLISEPRVYRWRQFDSGTPAAWYSSGTQTGYPGGGANELATAMAAWTTFSQAKIYYTYAGVRSGPNGGLDAPNGVNEVLFNDPLNEISGSYNASTGGVVGTGGFNGVSGATSWTAPFAADASHPAGAQTAYTITEGNLTIQDGVTSSAGISSNRLAEIVAHEFGHTLGLGHSAESTALMYAYVTGLGPSLRPDDQTAARWLYPNGSATSPPPPPPPPQVPAAPSNLAATVSGSNVILSWSDNASNETGQSIYVASGGGAFSKVTDLAANTTSTTLSGFAGGTYRLYVVASNGAGASAASNIVTITVGTQLVPAFTWSPSNPSTNDTVTFIDQSTGGVSSWSWTLGDGSVSQQQNPAKRYASAGTYNVTLSITRGIESAYLTKSITIAAPPPVTPLASYRSLVSAAAQQNGIGGTSWRTELSLFNAGTQGANVTALFIPAAGGTMVTRSLFLSPKQSAIYANTLLDLFGIANGAGALAIEATSAGANADLRVTSRTFTSGSIGTYGQSVPDIRSGDLETTLYLTGIQSSAAYRTNIGLVNRGGASVGATLTLYDSDGSTVSTASVTIPANNFQQSSLSSFFPEVTGRSYDVLSMRVTTSSQDVVTAYASVIDNVSQDPVYVQAMPSKGVSSMTLPVVGRANGVNGTFWRSDVTFFNPSGTRNILTLRYAGTTKTLSLNGRATFLLADVVTQMGFSSGSGPLDVSWSGNTGPVITSRTYTTDERGGTFGQSIDPVENLGNAMFVPGLRSDVNYRSNVGVLNGGSEAEELTVSLLSPAGFELASTRVVLQPKELMQQSVTALFPNVSASTGSFTLSVRGDANARVFAYGSMIDNASGDPVFFAGR